jgi:hypothetical protein
MKENKKAQKVCDRLWQEVNKLRHKKCLLCGGENEVGHHFIPKKMCAALRYSLENQIPLCGHCHCALHLTQDPKYNQKIVDVRGGEWYKRLDAMRNTIIKKNAEYYRIAKEVLTEAINVLRTT